MAKGVQHDPTAQFTRIPATGTGNNQVEGGRRTNITSGTGFWGRSIAFFDPADRAMTELPIRATFFVLMGGLAAILGNSLRQQRRE